MSSPRLVLVRHGESAHVHAGGALDRDAVESWRSGYDAAGILATSHPPPALVRLAAGATHIITSDLSRAIESAERLAPNRSVHRSELLREAPLEVPRWPTRLPLMAWGALIHTSWSLRIVRGIDGGEHRARAAMAAEWLSGLMDARSTGVVVTHGVFRRLLGQELARIGWTPAGRIGGYSPWSAWHFTGPADRT